MKLQYWYTSSGSDKNKLESFGVNFTRSATSFMKNSKSSIDLIIDNTSLPFEKILATETGLLGYHRLISTFFKAHFSSKKTLKIKYHMNYKKLNEENFLRDLKMKDFSFSTNDPHWNYDILTENFLSVLNKYAPHQKIHQR